MSTTDENSEQLVRRPRAPLTGYTLEALSDAIKKGGFPPYRAMQVMDWFYKKDLRDFAEMENISAAVAAYLADRFKPLSSSLVAAHDSGDGAVKLDIALADGAGVEAVLMEVPRRVTLCLSSQVGCPLGCTFCGSGQGGFERDLRSYEIVEQALHADSLLKKGKRISNVVFMGMGEPCLNLDAVFDAVRILNAPYAFHIGARHITISTLGDPTGIETIGRFPFELGLAVSLHAADDDLRRRLAPNAPAPVGETVEAAWRYFRKTGREVTYEYVLLAGVNDSTADASALAALLEGRHAFVNLIPYNEVEGVDFKRPSARKAAGFQRSLAARGIKAKVRRSLGTGAQAACGQLRLAKRPGNLK